LLNEQKRHTDLENAILLFAFNGECDDFDKWLQEKAKQLNADNRGDTVDAAKRKFEVQITAFPSLSNKPVANVT
jgi:spectrin beta